MINLLPVQMKKELRAARSNTLLLRYNILMVVALAFLAGAIYMTQYSLDDTKKDKLAWVQSNNSQVEGYAAVQAKAKEFRDNLAANKSSIAAIITPALSQKSPQSYRKAPSSQVSVLMPKHLALKPSLPYKQKIITRPYR